jgi:hypothetical protein
MLNYYIDLLNQIKKPTKLSVQWNLFSVFVLTEDQWTSWSESSLPSLKILKSGVSDKALSGFLNDYNLWYDW